MNTVASLPAKLLPCPFCGRNCQYVEHLEGTALHPAYRVRCDYCGASTGYTDKDCRADWNRRALATPAVEGDAGELPELPKITRFDVVGDIAYPLHEAEFGSMVYYDDHAAAMRAYGEQCRRLAIPEQPCCMCGKKVDTRENGTPGAELTDGRWTCGPECFEKAAEQPDSRSRVRRIAIEKGEPAPRFDEQPEGKGAFGLALRLLVAAGHVTEAKANEALCIAHGFEPGPLAPAAPVGVDAYEKGWINAAKWAQRVDLISDIGSAAYERDKTAALAGKEGA